MQLKRLTWTQEHKRCSFQPIWASVINSHQQDKRIHYRHFLMTIWHELFMVFPQSCCFSRQVLWPSSFHARWTFVLLYALGLGWGNFYAFTMIPSFTDVAANPELISIVISTTATTLCVTMFILFLLVTLFCCCCLLDTFHLPITWSLQMKSFVKFSVDQ